ncbi:glycosyltransferase family 2 protein [Alkalimarinus coralli]|uniref:glycosyltransferase family 2 protein n=1 Tax=Alkalimarinus coralli TaxID=2935863 RepID=UPI00202B2AF8|nr:glycosyltransferase family A protein [Alkalimarinus coralli]
MKKVSIVIPVYNGVNTIQQTVDSALCQSYPNTEVIVVDDHSSDGTWALLNELYSDKAMLIRHLKNSGGSAARNSGANAASGDYIAFLDADDEWYSSKLLSQVRQIENSELNNCVAVYCKAHNDKLEVLGENHTGQFIREVFCGEASIVSSSALLIKADVFHKIHGFDPSFMRHQDIELVIRLMKEGSIDIVNEPLFRKHYSGDASMRAVIQGISRFWRTFENDIATLSARDKRMVYARGYLRFFEVAYKENQYYKSIKYFLRSLLCTPRALWKKKGEYTSSLNKRLSW